MMTAILKLIHRRGGLIATLAIVILIVGQIAAAESSKSRSECPPLPPNCSCTPVIEDWEISCPNANPDILVRFQPGKYTHIECFQRSGKVYELLPQMDVGDTPMVRIQRCPLPPSQSIESILNRIGARRVRSIFFQNGVDLGGTLTHDNFRGLSELERLVLNRNGLSYLPSDLFTDLSNLTWLDLKSNRLHQLPRDIFVNLEKLNQLELGDNNLHNLEPGTFRNQKRLKHLNIWANDLNLTKNSFAEVSSILDLDINTNNLTTFEPDVFKLLTNLTNIHLSGNKFTSLPEGLFENNKMLTQIRMSENRQMMDTLPSKFLADLPVLKDVRLKAYLKWLPGNMFLGSDNIENISLESNLLETLPGELFMNQTRLIDLNLSHNKLVDLSDKIFETTKSLRVLDLSYNKLENISSYIFGGLSNLVVLNIQHNNLHHIHLRAFVGSRNIYRIEADNNKLSFKDVMSGVAESEALEIGSPFQYLSNLKSLNLRNNTIDYIFRDWIYNLPQLESLDLSYNQINSLNINDLQFSAMSLNLNLTHNVIEEIDFLNILDVELPEKNIFVEIGDNPLKCDCMILHFVQFLEERLAKPLSKNLKIETGNLRCSKPEKLKGHPVKTLSDKELLCPLDISNKTNRCPNGCECMVRLVDKTVIVDCSNLGLTRMPVLPNVTEFGMRSIELHVENNNISHITPDNLPVTLTLLNVSNNHISWINESVLGAMNRTSHPVNLSLGNNPWKCDCTSLDLLSFIRTSFQNINDIDLIKCTSGRKVSDHTKGSLCPESQIIIYLACTAAIVCLLFGVFATLYYRYQSEIKVWLYAHNMCLWFVSEEELDKDKKYDAFISYSHKDEDFIADHLVPNLEKGPIPYKLCIHVRNFIPGELIPSQIIKSVEESRRTIVVLSLNFLESVWGRLEFQAAHKAALREGRARVIVIIYGEIDHVHDLDPELKAYLSMNTYVKWGDPWFWSKLRYALPHPKAPPHAKPKGSTRSNTKNLIEDKLELINPIPVTPPPLTTPPAEQTSRNPLLYKLNGSVGNGVPVVGGQFAQQNVKIANGTHNGHVNGAYVINTNAKQSDV